MNKRIYFKDTQVAHEMEEYANKQLVKIEHFLENEPTPVFIDLTIAPSKVHEHHRVELRVKSPHYNLICEHEKEGDGVYEALDKVIDTMYRRLHEEKARRIDDRNHGMPKAKLREEEAEIADEDEE